MAPSRGGNAKPPTAPDPQPRCRPGFGARLLVLFRTKPLETLLGLGGLGTVLGTGVAGLGFVILRAREALLGLSPGLSYPKQEWLFTGFHSLGALLWRGLSVLASDHPVLKWSAWTLLLLVVSIVLAARAKRRLAVLLGALALSTLLLAVGIAFYRVALAANADPSQGLNCGEKLSANLADRAAFETCSWLMNDTPRNDGRRSDIGGLLGWLLAACCTAAVVGARASITGRWFSRARWTLVFAHVILALLVLAELPRAHAFATWGLRYPQVRLQEKENCDPEVARATAAGSCWAFDVSAGAEKRAVFLRGSGCPEGRDGTFLHLGTADTDGSECFATLSSPPRVITYGPNP